MNLRVTDKTGLKSFKNILTLEGNVCSEMAAGNIPDLLSLQKENQKDSRGQHGFLEGWLCQC